MPINGRAYNNMHVVVMKGESTGIMNHKGSIGDV